MSDHAIASTYAALTLLTGAYLFGILTAWLAA